MKSTTTISIGIPAYNEEANIKQLLTSILAQVGENFRLQKIYVVSDGSSDNTAQEVHAIKDSRITFRAERKRLGKSARLEEILRLNTADVLLLMDADVVFKDINLFSKLIQKVDFTKTGIAAINARSLPPSTFFQRSLDASVYGTKLISERWHNGDNYLSFKGCFIAMSGKLAKKVHIPSRIINNDVYLYLMVKKEGWKAKYVKECEVYFHSPLTLSDHIKQSSRYQYAREELRPFFNNIDVVYTLPRKLVITSLLKSFLKNHIYLISYLFIRLLTKMKRHRSIRPAWSIAGSTKRKLALNN